MIGVIATALIVVAVSAMVISRKLKKKEAKQYKPGIVYLHQFPAGGGMPSFSMPCLKLETYLRLADIEYEDCRAMQMGPLGKCPWIEVDGEAVPDSDTCIDYLAQRWPDKNLDANVSAADLAVAHLVKRTLEEHLYWSIVYNRWVEQVDLTIKTVLGMSGFMGWMVGKKVIAASIEASLRAHGLGRHPRTELYHRAAKDLKAISVSLGSKKFFGGEKPCATDAACFAFVANAIWGPFKNPLADVVRTEFTNLQDHAKRVRDLAWPDWDDRQYYRDSA